MRKAIVWSLGFIGMVAFLFVTFKLAWASSDNPPTSGETKGGPNIVFEETAYNFGKVGKEESVKHDFKFKNTGDATLVIGDIKTTCGCTGTLLSKKELAPGEEGNVEVTFQTGASSGQKKKSIYVNSNDVQQPSVQLDIMAEVLVPVEIKPLTLYWVAERNKESTRTVELLYSPDLKLNIKGLELSSPAFTASFQPKSGAKSPGYDINIKYDGTLPAGSFQHKLTILTDNPSYPSLVASLRGKVVGPVKVVPDAINLGGISDEALPVRTIQVYDTDKQDFKITEVKSTSPIISVELVDEESGRYSIKAALTAKPPQGAFSERLLIKTNDPTQSLIEVPINAYIK